MQTKPREVADFLAARVKSASPSPTVAVSNKARELKAQGIDVIDLGGGDPDFITPENIRLAATEAMNAGDTHYVASNGTPALKKALVKKLLDDNRLEYDPGEIMVTPGGKQALFAAMLATVEEGVDVMLLEPAWVSYASMVEIAGGRVVPVSLDPDTNFRVTRELLEAAVTPGTRGLMVNSPSNPTGRVLTLDEIQAICDFAIEHDILVYTDEMYEKIIYGGRQHYSIAAFPGMWDRTLTFNGLSKAYAMTGWRLGYVAGPRAFIDEMGKVQSHSVSQATSFVQAAAVQALLGPQESVGQMVQAWDRRRHMVTNGLNKVKGMRCPLPEGAFYAFPDARETGMSSVDLGAKLLQEARVAVTPGIAFGQAGEGHFRVSFATADELLEDAIQRVGDALGWR
ncbi:MAG TPA: pyridoxal phosphate-dependent aminotransferase [Thermomicrobiales bacterium]|nr:pyridoxal phosphate-dependent aminotransferase [Thermomicrobiales bacterium]